MSRTIYIPVDEINDLQKKVMMFIDHWVRNEKTPVPHSKILVAMKKEKIPAISIAGAITALLHKGYIRRAVIISNKTYYVMLRTI